MSLRWIPTPGPGRITLALLAVVPAAMAYPWRSPRDYWLLGIAAAVVIVLFGCWRGLYFTTLLRRRLAIMGRGEATAAEPGSATATTALLRVGAHGDDAGPLPLPLIARYLDRYGIRADKIRITNRDNASDATRRETWIGVTISATDNLAALRARSERIPLRETAEVTARRLADHLRELGWQVTSVAPDDVPRLLTAKARERWSGVQRGASDYLAAYRIQVDAGLAETLEAVRAHRGRETCTAVEFAGDGTHTTVAAACAFLTDTPPRRAAPVPGLIAQRGNHRPALAALDLLSTRRLDGHTEAPVGLLAQLDWPPPVNEAPAAETART
ncbi:type VII secretion protein EccE [Mycobacterium sp. SMC-2]|uniref:type VII secretion protein EccE n=1 Tax=Mycobacterium sp. SMC-2 TaxID=2857058 RepID=UPI0021FB48E4|nr:type VII secretion protein EccE [Mycobacterium sp. SMC-2]UXA07568.1 type VII secretion protein EccE [Mycobacterium sp. SMC-2]